MGQLVFIENHRPVTDSLLVADTFSKKHADVLRAIRHLECSEEFNRRNFAEINYTDKQNRTYPKFLITQDGFVFLAMGFTGKEAARFKEMYINEFNRMREQLNRPAVQQPLTEIEILQRSIGLLAEQSKRIAEMETRMAQLEQASTSPLELTESSLDEETKPVSWRKHVNDLLLEITKHRKKGGYLAFSAVKADSYRLLEEQAGCDLSSMLARLRSKLTKKGWPKSRTQKLSRMDVIAEDDHLKDLYLSIVESLMNETSATSA